MNGDKIFVDTNVIIYAYSLSADRKHKVASKIMEDLWRSGLGVLSTQVLQEFFVTVTKKIPKPLDIKSSARIVRDLLKWNVVINDGESILDAIDIQQRYKFSFWDSMIIDAAIRAGSATILSEDLSHGQVIEDVTIVNPFI